MTPAGTPTSVKRHPRPPPALRAVVAVQPVGPSHHGHVEVGPAVVVVVPAHDPLHEADEGHPGLPGPLAERPVALVVEELARVLVARPRLVSHEEVEPAVPVVVEPGRGLGGSEPQQPGRAGHVGEGAVAEVPEERQGEAPLGAQPAAPQDEHVHEPVVVVVRRDQVEAAHLAPEACRLRAVREGAAAVVPEEPHLVREPLGGGREVEEAVVVEVLEDGATREAEDVEADLAGHVVEARQRVIGGEHRRRYPLAVRHPGGMAPEGHVGDVEQPSRGEIVRPFGQDAPQRLDGPCRALAPDVDAPAADGEQAGVAGGPVAVLVLGHAHIRGHLEHAGGGFVLAPVLRLVRPRVALQDLERLQAVLEPAGVDQLDCRHALQGQARADREATLELADDEVRAPVAHDVRDGHGVDAGRALPQQGGHLPGARAHGAARRLGGRLRAPKGRRHQGARQDPRDRLPPRQQSSASPGGVAGPSSDRWLAHEP